MSNANCHRQPLKACTQSLIWLLALWQLALYAAGANSQSATPSTPREFFNLGTQKMREGKLREAEAFLESALSSQVGRFQPPALYNLGHVRFSQGIDELKKGPRAGPTTSQARGAAENAAQAARAADEALAGNDVQTMVAAYLRGRGARRESKAAAEAVRRALEVFGVTLRKWQRSSSDFRSAFELSEADVDARQNAEVVDRSIAKLVDSLREMQQMDGALSAKSRELGEKMKQLRGRIPAPDMPPGAAGDDEEEEEMPFGPKLGEKEGPSKEGQEMTLSPEQAGWLLEGFRLDTERRLPMAQQEAGQPKERGKKTW